MYNLSFKPFNVINRVFNKKSRILQAIPSFWLKTEEIHPISGSFHQVFNRKYS